MINQEWEKGTSTGAVQTLIDLQAEYLYEMVPCPKKSKLEQIHHKLKRKLEALQQAIKDSDRVAEHKVLHTIASTITRYYRILKTDDLG